MKNQLRTPLSHWPTGGRNFAWEGGADVRSLRGDRYQGEILRGDGDWSQNSMEFNLEFCVRMDTHVEFCVGADTNVERLLRFFPWGWKKHKFCVGTVPRIPTHPHAIFLCGDAWRNAWDWFMGVSETGVSSRYGTFNSFIEERGTKCMAKNVHLQHTLSKRVYLWNRCNIFRLILSRLNMLRHYRFCIICNVIG